MVRKHIVRNVVDLFLQGLQVFRPAHLLQGLGIAKDKRSEAKILNDEVAQLQGERLGVFVHESHTQALSQALVGEVGRLHQGRQMGIVEAHLLYECDAQLGFLVTAVPFLKTYIADDPKQILLVSLVQIHGLIVGLGQKDFGPSPHAKHLLVLIECFGHKIARLLHHNLVKFGQVGGSIADGVLHQDDALYPDFLNVVGGIHPIFDQLNDRQQEVGVPQPAEDIVDGREVLVLQSDAYLPVEVGEDHNGNLIVLFPDALGQGEGIILSQVQHFYHQIDVAILHDSEGLGRCGGFYKNGGIAKIQRHILVEDLLVDAPILLQHEEVIVGRDDEHSTDALLHQQVEGCMAEVDGGVWKLSIQIVFF